MKKLMGLFVAIITIFSLAINTWSCSDVKFLYEKLNDGTYAVSLRKAGSQSGTLEIPSEHNNKAVTVIKPYAFQMSTELEEVILPDTIVSISAGCFDHCKFLRKVHMPKTMKSIGDFAFNGCESIDEFIFPKGIQRIATGVLSNCFGVTKVYLPSTVTLIDEGVFLRCDSLSDVFYDGTKMDFEKIEKNNNWQKEAGNFVVHCTDGDIDIK